MYQRKRGVAQYGKVSTVSEVEYASPHRLVQMLMEGALDKISIAKGHMERRDIPNKGKYISWAMSIINGLRGSLDLDKGGEIAANLENLYEYMNRRLMEASRTNQTQILDEVFSLLVEIKEAWDAIPDHIKGVPATPSAGIQSLAV